MRNFKLLILYSIVICFWSCESQIEKINGVSFVASREAVDATHIKPVVEVNANYAAIMPFGFVRDMENPEIIFNTERQWFGERSDGAKQYIEELRKQDIKVMLKPQLWIGRGDFTGYMEMKTEESWKILEDSYSKFILEYANLAQEMKVPIFCIGTELEKFVGHRSEYWQNLIKDIKKIYKGKLTYAANWDEFKRTPFWSELDYIGLDAYFPICTRQTPTFETSMNGWAQHKPVIKSIADTYQKPVLFTEFGYRSVDYAGKEPWRYDRSMNQVNLEAQVNTTKALFETFWEEDWFAGGFVWKWFIRHDDVGGEDNSQFTPQNKPAEAIIRQYYKKQG